LEKRNELQTRPGINADDAGGPTTQQAGTQAANSHPKPNDVVVHNFVFGDGENLASLKLHYLTLGKARRDASGATTNGVLLLHGTAGSSADLVTPG
jgi:homoserine acetyltransferase